MAHPVRSLCAYALVATWLAGCPVAGGGGTERTDWTRWTDGVNTTLTRTETAPAASWEELLRTVPGARVHHADQQARASGLVTLVRVQPSWGRPPGNPAVPLVTELELESGELVRRRWTAPARAPTWFALVAVPSPPRIAATAILQ